MNESGASARLIYTYFQYMVLSLSPAKLVTSMDLRAQELQGSFVDCEAQGTCGAGP